MNVLVYCEVEGQLKDADNETKIGQPNYWFAYLGGQAWTLRGEDDWPPEDDLTCTDNIAISATIYKFWMLDGDQGMDEGCKDLADVTSL